MADTPQLTDLELAEDISEVTCPDCTNTMENNDSSEVEDPLPEGYSEALADCHALAVNLLQKAINGKEINRCWNCLNWFGRCLKGVPNKTARDEACEGFRSIGDGTIA